MILVASCVFVSPPSLCFLPSCPCPIPCIRSRTISSQNLRQSGHRFHRFHLLPLFGPFSPEVCPTTNMDNNGHYFSGSLSVLVDFCSRLPTRMMYDAEFFELKPEFHQIQKQQWNSLFCEFSTIKFHFWIFFFGSLPKDNRFHVFVISSSGFGSTH